MAYTPDAVWRNRGVFVTGREEIIQFLTSKRERELGYALRKSPWGYCGNRIAVRFQYEWCDATGRSWRSYGNELWQFSPDGLMGQREASINDVQIEASDRRIAGPRPQEEHGVGLPLH